MPLKTLDTMAKKAGINPKTVERYWEEGKKTLKGKFTKKDKSYYPYLMGIVKKRIKNKKSNENLITKFSEFCNEIRDVMSLGGNEFHTLYMWIELHGGKELLINKHIPNSFFLVRALISGELTEDEIEDAVDDSFKELPLYKRAKKELEELKNLSESVVEGKWFISYGLGGGFGGADNFEVIEATNDEEASRYAWQVACDNYESYEGMGGLRTVQEIMEEEGYDEDEAYQQWEEEREGWLDYDAVPYDPEKHDEYL